MRWDGSESADCNPDNDKDSHEPMHTSKLNLVRKYWEALFILCLCGSDSFWSLLVFAGAVPAADLGDGQHEQAPGRPAKLGQVHHDHGRHSGGTGSASETAAAATLEAPATTKILPTKPVYNF